MIPPQAPEAPTLPTAATPCAHAYSAGSPAALDVLLVLSRWPSGLRRDDLVVQTGLPTGTITRALQGLKARGRVVLEGRGKASLWRCAHHVAAAGQASELPR